MGKILLRVNEAAEALSVSRWTIYRWVEEGKLKGTKIGKGSLRVLKESVVQLIDQNRLDRWDESATVERRSPRPVRPS
ncbi:HTH_17 domain-containing protein [Nitrospira tepida]|uniref:HTH_17 domain-containing protein n=1 Tax=Nitrospira tepida TaxID=2973512 RepID=A0AA86MWX7_9BACT|nr:helix-turn-helix domain-containing protein [Nitrospira tepida]CAI4030512.1 HTH_17 domain-containing protein [Nitrospira tepida]